MRRNLILILKLDVSGFFFNFGNGMDELFYDSRVIGNDFLYDGLSLASFGEVSCVVNVLKKRSLIRESSTML